MVTKSWKCQTFNHTTILNSWSWCDMVCFLNRFKFSKVSFDQVKINLLWNSLPWNVVNVFTSCFKFWRKNFTTICCCHTKGNQGWRYRQFFKGPWHGVLTTDWWQTKLDLCLDRTKKSSYWLTKAIRLFIHAFKVFLVRETRTRPISTCCYQASCCFNNSVSCTMIRWPLCNIRIESLCHNGSCRCDTVLNRKFLNWTFCWRDLITTTNRMINRWTTNRAIKDGL